jgi:hypothetical protein
LVALCVACSGCATPQPTANQTPQLSHKEELSAFEAILRYKLAQTRFPRHSKVYVEALEIFPNAHPRPAPVQELSARFPDYKIVVIPDDSFTSDLWFQIYLNSTDGTIYYFSVHDLRHVNTFRMAKRGAVWVVIGIDPVIVTGHRRLTNRSSQPLAAVKSTVNFMKQSLMFATLAPASGGSAPSR